jgi:hypothetical protein
VKKNKAGGIKIPNCKLYYRDIAIKNSIKTVMKTSGTEWRAQILIHVAMLP